MLIQRYPYKLLTRKNINNKRYYVTSNNLLASVTSILSATKNEQAKNALKHWKSVVGENKATYITKTASLNGTRIHKYLENYIKFNNLGNSSIDPTINQSYKMAQQIINNGLQYATEFFGSEVHLYFAPFYAGATDLIATYKNKLSIIDFKQTNKLKSEEWVEDYKLQLVAYALAHNNMFGTDIRQGIIMMCSRDLQYQQFEINNDTFNFYANMWWDRVEQYYQQLDIK
jgi:hypothetical protein